MSTRGTRIVRFVVLGSAALAGTSCETDGALSSGGTTGGGSTGGRRVAESVFTCRGTARDKLDPATNAAESAARARDIIRQAGGSIGFTSEEGTSARRLLSGVDGAPVPVPAVRELAGLPLGDLLPVPDTVPPVSGVMKRTAVVRALASPIPSMLTVEEQFDDTAADVEALLRDRLLADPNLETKSDREFVYLLKGDPTCRPLPSQTGAQPAVDAECAGDLQRLQVRIIARPDCDGTRYVVVLGPDRLELLQLVLRSDLLAVEMDLAKARRASEYANRALGKTDPADKFPDRLEGALRVGLQKLGVKKATFVVAVTAPLQIETTDQEPVQIRMATGEPFSLTGDGVARTLTVATAVGQTDIKSAWDPQDLGLRNFDFHVSVGGLYGQATLSEAQKELSLKGLGVGKTFVAVRGTHIFDLDLNPDQRRAFDLREVLVANDRTRFEIAPKLDLSLAFNLRAVARELDEPPEMHLLGETYKILFAPGGSPPAVFEPIPSTPTRDGALKIVAGTLTFSTSADPRATVTVPAGKCLVDREAPPGTHPFLGGLQAADCPL